jgi:hypothetical protein
VDILDYHRGLITPRRMCVFVDGLIKHHHDSELFKKLYVTETGDSGYCSYENRLMIHLINEIKVLDYHLICSNASAEDAKKVPKPRFMKVPGERELTKDEQQEHERLAKLEEFRASMHD